MIIDSRYEVIEELGSGVWAIVYKVNDIRTNKIHALKLFQKINATSLYEKFSPENMHHITKIQHPNLIHVSNFGNFGDHIYYLSDYYHGNSLANFKLKASNLELMYDIIVQICYGLNALHSQNIIHKDLKPANVVYTIKNNKPEVKIMDYGFTKIDVEKSQQKISSTLPYMAPEIYLDQTPVYQSDFYSLGVILYKITTGILPYTVEQISGFIAGDSYNLFPKFPRELNPDIPEELEKLTLKLLEKTPEDRFENNESIISYINQIQIKQYPFSQKWSIVNNIRFSDYIVREDYSHQLLEYVPLVEQGNGKIIVLNAGTGLGKSNILALFRYHLLTDKYFIFDYKCSLKQKDPFFALIKEFHQYIASSEKFKTDISKISKKLKEYLFGSEDAATVTAQDEEELSIDFQSASNFIFHLSEEKPLIFMIRSVQYVEKEVIDFVNFISKDIINRPILIILSVNDPRKIEGLIHPVQIKIEALNFEQTTKYVTRLLKQTPPDDFLEKLWKRSNGNPLFIEQILIDLTDKRKIWRFNKFEFNYNLDFYRIPDEIKHSIYLRMAHLSEKSYRIIQKLASIHTPLSKNLIKFVLDISDKELFFLLKDGLNNEILLKKDEFYHFTFKEAVTRFNKESSHKDKVEISRKILLYFDDKVITIISILKGIIKHAYFVKDYKAVRKYRLLLVDLYMEQDKQEKAFDEICTIAELDFSGKFKIKKDDLSKDLFQLVNKSEWSLVSKTSDRLKKYIYSMPDISEKHIVMGVFYLLSEKYNISLSRFKKALKLAVNDFQRIFVLLKMGEIFSSQNNFVKLGECIEELEKYDLKDNFKISFIGLKALNIGLTGKIDEAISLIEDYIPTIKTRNDDNYFIKLGALHNNLAFLYHRKKFLDEADKNFQITKNVWEKSNYIRKLGVVYNNIGDVALIQGDTKTALEYFDKAIKICKRTDSKKIMVLSLLNFGETYIKLGKFLLAENYLNQALEASLSFENRPFYDSIINNLAISKSKVNNFSYYLNFIKENFPEIIKGHIEKINPLTKTYFYFLYNLGNYDTIEKLLKKHKNMFMESKEQESFNQIYGFLYLKRGEYSKARDKIEQAFKYSEQNKSVYAQAINYIRLAECHLGIGDTAKAIDICRKAESICLNNDFNYWLRVVELRKIKAQMTDGSISLRILIRRLFVILKYVQKNDLYFLEIEIYELLVQIYASLNVTSKAKLFFDTYKNALNKAVTGLNEKDREIYLRKSHYYLKDYTKLETVKIFSQKPEVIEDWQEELYDILKLNSNRRIKFFIDKTFQKLLSPNFYSIVLNDEIKLKSPPFLSYNIDDEKLYSDKFLENIKECIEKNKIVPKMISTCHTLFIPLRIKTARIGCMVIGDKGELVFQSSELNMINNLRLHLSSILIRITEFTELNKKMELMTKLIEVNQKFFSVMDINKLEQEIVSFVLDFIGGSRGFLIKKDKFQNYVFTVALDDSKQLLKNYTYISKSVLGEVQKTREPLFIMNAKDDVTFKGYIDLTHDSISVYCYPIIVDNHIYGFLYLDNYKTYDNRITINKEFMRLLMIQIKVSIKNAQQYETLKAKNIELSTLDNLKNDFINIVSHELKTPLVTLQGYVNRMKKIKLSEKESKILQCVEKSVERLYQTTGNIVNHNKYILAKDIDKSIVNISDILEVIADEAVTISKERHMQIKLEIESNLPTIKINWEAFHLMITNIVMNSIRFTKDFGTIIIGARHSAFQQEEVNGKESIVVYIQDNGIGIPQHELKKVFQKFYELSEIYSHSSGTVEFKSSGLGLGLSTAGIIAKLHDGKIWINSKVKEGTTVFIAIPIIEEDVSK